MWRGPLGPRYPRHNGGRLRINRGAGLLPWRGPSTVARAFRPAIPNTNTMPVLTRTAAIAWADRLRAEGKKIVFTNGCFDLLHPGHVRYLAEARAHGDVLIVAANSDRSVRAIKGPSRPINSEQDRAEVLAALACVDAVVIFDEPDPHAIISAIQPDILVKGADWAADAIIGRDVVEARGGQVVRIAFAPGFSTTSMIARIQNS